jgi:hypothetical protein
MPKDPAILAHQEWLGYVQPTGLVVSIPALVDASAFLNRNYGPDHQRFLSALPQDADHEVVPEIPDFVQFARDVLNWDASLLNGSPDADPLPAELEINLESYIETLRPKYALKNLEGERKWLLLVDVFPTGTDLDQPFAPHDRAWQASPQARFEKLLRQTGVGTGLLVNGREIRLVYAPEKELSGYITFKLAEMVRVAGRPIFAALLMLLNSERLYSVAEKERLPAILANSRKYQNVVSTQLAEQVLEALYEMLRGFQAANDQTKGELLREVLARDPDHVYHGLLTTLLRLVFVLYAEDRALLSTDPVYSNYYSVRGLFERLRADAGRYNDTMDQRYGAWAQLLALFRLVYSGGSHGGMTIPAREGYLFDPDRYLFLEGRHDKKEKPVIPRVSDGVLYRVLSNLVLLDGERLSYRWLAVEQIGSVYQAIMGFSLQVATGRSIAIRSAKRHGAPATINLEALLSTAPDKRLKRFNDETDQKLTGPSAEALKLAATIEDILAALERKIAKTVTPVPVPKDAMVFQPSDERRRSGSHYTPSSLTGPIVEAALEPVLKQLGPNPTPAQILNLKVCDLAMGSAAFLVESCRQLGDALTRAWHTHNEVQTIPPDEDETLYAQRMIAQRCVYGLDKNPMAADLAKLSLWLATLARNHPFTFLDHSLRHGDALVGLTRKQIASFHWAPAGQQSFLEARIRELLDFVTRQRREILDARENTPYSQLAQELAVAEDRLSLPRMIGDGAIAAFFSAEKPKKREEVRKGLLASLEDELRRQGFISVDGELDQAIHALRNGKNGTAPFHWEIEFPEVFERENPGFDVIVGNPPFLGGTMISTALGPPYRDYIAELTSETGGRCDLVAYFFRRAFVLCRQQSTQGLIGTKTIAQGDTRRGGLSAIVAAGGTVFRAYTSMKWPGEAAVTVSVVHISKDLRHDSIRLNDRLCQNVSPFLLPSTSNDEPRSIATDLDYFLGSKLYGQGFLFDDGDSDATPVAEMRSILEQEPACAGLIRPYVGGEEVNSALCFGRWVIDFGEMSESEAREYRPVWKIVSERLRASRANAPEQVQSTPFWWFFNRRTQQYLRARALPRVLVRSAVSEHHAFRWMSPQVVFSHNVFILIESSSAAFALLHSRVHEEWVKLTSSSLEDRQGYRPSDCLETFAMPEGWRSNSVIESIGTTYTDFRDGMMLQKGQGLTAIYNDFHNPDQCDAEILNLRELHTAMDRAVLDAYGWTDIDPKCQFISGFEDQDGEEEEAGRKHKLKYRYRWSEEVRDRVLARLLDLNRRCALAEGQVHAGTGEHLRGPNTKSHAKKRKSGAIEVAAELFDPKD